MKRKAIAVLLTTIPLLPLTGQIPAQAKDQTPCSITFEGDVSPGLSTSPSSGTYDTNGETGTADCKGKVNGKTVTGPGTFGTHGRYGTTDPDSCTAGGEGTGTASITVPTADGPQHVTAPYSYTFRPLENGVLAVTFKGEQWNGTAEVRPTKGDCVSAPMSRMAVSGNGTLTT